MLKQTSTARFVFALALVFAQPLASAQPAQASDPFNSMQWPALSAEFLGEAGQVRFDPRVQVKGPAFAEDAMHVPISIVVQGLGPAEVEQITVLVDRNPIRKVLDYFPNTQLGTLPRLSFRFKLEQASAVRAAVKTRDGVWHVGGTWVDSAGGGCTAPAATRSDGSWARTLGQVSLKPFARSTPAGQPEPGSRLRLRIMHPMDTGLVGGVPAFYVKQLRLVDAEGQVLLRLQAFEPVSENPVFSFDFAQPSLQGLHLLGSDNNGNKITGALQ